jgi:hypothetical protein
MSAGGAWKTLWHFGSLKLWVSLTAICFVKQFPKQIGNDVSTSINKHRSVALNIRPFFLA